MKPHVTLITLGVSDLQRSLEFYRDGLALPTDGILGDEFEYGATVNFRLDGNLILALWPYTSIQTDSGVETGRSETVSFSLAHNVNSKEEVDEVLIQAEAAGAQIVDRPKVRFWGGYGGYFRDPDGHLWEVAWNPDIVVED